MLPPNLSAYNKAGRTYYRYTFPDGQRRGLGSDMLRACQLATALNKRLENLREETLLQRLTHGRQQSSPFTLVCADFKQRFIQSPERGYSARSLEMRLSRLHEYTRHWASTPIDQISTFDIAQFLKARTQEAARQHRILLKQLFTFAAEEGLIERNPVSATNPRKQPKAQRQRHTWEGFCAILEASPPWLNRALRLALYSLQRRGDLITMHRSQVNMPERTLRVTQQKTGVDLLIVMGDDLYQVIHECMTSPVHCPYLIHHRPERLTQKTRAAKTHPLAVTGPYLTRAFAEVRDNLKVYDHLPKLQRPGIHAVRALGIFALQKAGFPLSYIQALAGHADQAMTEHYIEGHEKPVPLRVEAGLKPGLVDWTKVDWKSRTSELWRPAGE